MASVARNTVWLIAQQVLTWVVTLYVVSFLARRLGKVQYGAFAYAFSLAGMFAMFMFVGTRAQTVRALAAMREDIDAAGIYLGKAVVAWIGLSLAGYVVFLATCLALGYPAWVQGVLALAGIALFAELVKAPLNDLFQSREEMRVPALSGLGVRVFTGLGAVGALLVGADLLVVTAIYAVGPLVGAALMIRAARRRGARITLRLDPAFSRELLRKGLPFALLVTTTVLYARLDQVMLSKLRGVAEVGVYAVAAILIERVEVLPDAAGTVAFAFVAARVGAADRETVEEVGKTLGALTYYMTLLGVAMAVGGAIGAPALVRLLYGPEYIASGPVFALLSLKLPALCLRVLAGYAISAAGRERVVLWTVLVGLALNAGLNAVLIPPFGATGAALATLVADLFTAGVLVGLMFRHLSPALPWRRIPAMLFSAGAMGAAIWPLRHLSFLVILPVAGAVFGTVALLTGALKLAELRDFARRR